MPSPRGDARRVLPRPISLAEGAVLPEPATTGEPAPTPTAADLAGERPPQVRDSLVAAMLAGLVVGCALAGLDVADVGHAIQPLAGLLGVDVNAAPIVPVVLLLGLIGGGRAAATSLLLAHAGLKRLRRSDHLSYALGGVAAAMAFAGFMVLVTGSAPTHGWLIDALGGAAGGYFYRVFAGLKPA